MGDAAAVSDTPMVGDAAAFGNTAAALGDPAVPFADPAPIGDTAANGDMAVIAAIGNMAIVTYETHAFHPGQNIYTLRCEWRGRRGEATSLLASLTKAKDLPRSCTSAG